MTEKKKRKNTSVWYEVEESIREAAQEIKEAFQTELGDDEDFTKTRESAQAFADTIREQVTEFVNELQVSIREHVDEVTAEAKAYADEVSAEAEAYAKEKNDKAHTEDTETWHV